MKDKEIMAGERRATPRSCALRTENERPPKGTGERFAGYGVVALPFEGGDLLAFRRFPASSIGGGYSAIWHRDRAGEWTFYVSIDPSLACPRYFGEAIDRVVVADIEVTWVGHDHLVVSAPAPRVEWSMRIVPGRATRAVALLGGLISPLTGSAPNGQRFLLRPRRVWRIEASAARIEGRELGPIGGGRGGELGDFRLPGTGLFACGTGEFERFEPGRHSTRVARRVERT